MRSSGRNAHHRVMEESYARGQTPQATLRNAVICEKGFCRRKAFSGGEALNRKRKRLVYWRAAPICWRG